MGMSGALLPYESCSNFPIIDMSQLHYGHFCPGCRWLRASTCLEALGKIRFQMSCFKQEIFERMLSWHKPYHGHEVVCAVHLHYYWDMNHGTDAWTLERWHSTFRWKRRVAAYSKSRWRKAELLEIQTWFSYQSWKRCLSALLAMDE